MNKKAVRQEKGSATIYVRGHFTIDTCSEFKAHANDVLVNAHGREVRVDLAETEHIDCAALGLLLLLRDRAKAQGKTVLLAGAKGQVSMTLAVANFSRLFAII